VSQASRSASSSAPIRPTVAMVSSPAGVTCEAQMRGPRGRAPTRRLFVDGPDATGWQHQSRAWCVIRRAPLLGRDRTCAAGGTGRQVRDQTPDLEELWPSAEAPLLAERVAEDPVATLEAWAVERAASREVDPLGPRILRMAAAGVGSWDR
jgi:hypothetical protein